MRLKLSALVLVGMSVAVSADENSAELKRNNWIEMGVGSVSTLEFKTALGNRGWALAASAYDEVEIFGDGYMTKDGQHKIDDGVSELDARRAAENAKGPAAWKPSEVRPRKISASLKAYALLATSADKGAVRDLSKLD